MSIDNFLNIRLDSNDQFKAPNGFIKDHFNADDLAFGLRPSDNHGRPSQPSTKNRHFNDYMFARSDSSEFIQDPMTKLRSAGQRTTLQVPDHVAQVVAPPVHMQQAQRMRSSASSSYQSSSSEGSSSGRHSPSLTGLCNELAHQEPAPCLRGNITNEQKLIDLQNSTGYQIVQRNGQRIFGPPPNWTGKPPSKGSEIFVGRVPRDCFEPELLPVFEKIGPIYELRLMMDFSGSNRGFFFVRYTCREDAKRAVKELNGYEIRPNKCLGVLHSLDNNKLWISGIPNNVTKSDIKAEIENLTEGVVDVILYRSQTDKTKPRKYAFVEYETHRAAALARRRLVPTKILLKGQEVEKVDWAEPEQEVDEEIMKQVKVLFVRNLTEATTEEYLRQMFDQWSDGHVERVKKAKDFAFVHLLSRGAAELAKQRADGVVIDGEAIEVEWSKPVDKNAYNTRKYLTKILSTPAPQCMQRFDGPMSSFINPGHMCGDGMIGAPGTPPPRNLIRKLTGSGLSLHNQLHRGGHLTDSNANMYVNQTLDPAILRALHEMRMSQSPTLLPHLGPHQPLNGVGAVPHFDSYYAPLVPPPMLNPFYHHGVFPGFNGQPVQDFPVRNSSEESNEGSSE